MAAALANLQRYFHVVGEGEDIEIEFGGPTAVLRFRETDPALRGRVIAILLAILLGSTPLGAPMVGWVADTFGPRWAMALAAASGLGAAVIGLRYLVKYRGWRLGRGAQPQAGAEPATAVQAKTGTAAS